MHTNLVELRLIGKLKIIRIYINQNRDPAYRAGVIVVKGFTLSCEVNSGKSKRSSVNVIVVVVLLRS